MIRKKFKAGQGKGLDNYVWCKAKGGQWRPVEFCTTKCKGCHEYNVKMQEVQDNGKDVEVHNKRRGRKKASG